MPVHASFKRTKNNIPSVMCAQQRSKLFQIGYENFGKIFCIYLNISRNGMWKE